MINGSQYSCSYRASKSKSVLGVPPCMYGVWMLCMVALCTTKYEKQKVVKSVHWDILELNVKFG